MPTTLSVIPTILDIAAGVIKKRLVRSDAPAITTPASAASSATSAINDAPDIAIVNVKPTYLTGDFWVRLVAFISAGLALFFGREVVSPEVQLNVVGVIAAAIPLYEYWRSRRRTSITKAASVNMLEKPSQ